MRLQRGSCGEVCEVNQGDLLLVVAQSTGWRIASLRGLRVYVPVRMIQPQNAGEAFAIFDFR